MHYTDILHDAVLRIWMCISGNSGLNMCCGNVLTWAAITPMRYFSICRDCKDHVAWHSDDESLFGRLPTIASVSLGDTRMFEMRKKVPPVSSCCIMFLLFKMKFLLGFWPVWHSILFFKMTYFIGDSHTCKWLSLFWPWNCNNYHKTQTLAASEWI